MYLKEEIFQHPKIDLLAKRDKEKKNNSYLQTVLCNETLKKKKSLVKI